MSRELKDYLTPKETADVLRVSPITVRVWAQKGLLKASTTAGGHRRFEREEVERFAREKGIELSEDTEMRALIVDDDLDHLELLADVFKEHLPDVVIETARDGFEAGQKVASFKPKVVLLDLLMPGVDGFKACRSIKENASSKDVRVIAMTGYMSDENVRKIKHSGAEVCLEKPLDIPRLIALLQEA
ncbi:response regulator [Agarilytica rhodophyticola]|uniref:response regulator n=1 Tax=Agarilytica rhodophyticola TaxID=1737490 RepID=UPI000B3417ED|nr:response regulator [Agarilytica rhodophyticola]